MGLTPYLDDGDIVLYAGDCTEVLAALPPDSIDACVTDPPYGLSAEPDMAEVLRHWLAGDDYQHRGGGFMGRTWDSFVPGPAVWREVYRVLKPGGHVLAFSGTRTSDMQTTALRLAGFEIRDCLVWLYGSGFPKSLDVSKAIDRAAGAEREVVGEYRVSCGTGDAFGKAVGDRGGATTIPITAPATPAAAQWQGWGTALKPGHEPIVVARKPLAERTVAAQVLATGTGAINVDGCRIACNDKTRFPVGYKRGFGDTYAGDEYSRRMGRTEDGSPNARWPANVVLDEEAARLLDETVGERPSGNRAQGGRTGMGFHGAGGDGGPAIEANSGGPSRFFYTAKASSEERDGSSHPTVKPLALMRWLVRLVTPPGGVVLDPFAGSGTTLRAAREEGFRAIGIEREPEYLADAAHRLRQLSLFGELA